MRRGALCLILVLAFAEARGLDEPVRSQYDGRIRSVAYNPEDVVAIDVVIGIATHIVLEPGEEYVTHAFGDQKAWDFAYRQNHYFIKAVETKADTNLIIVTNRRSYHFRLKFWLTRDTTAMYEVAFRYPDTAAKSAKEIARRKGVEEGFRGKRKTPNLQYSMSGDLDIAPVNAWDDQEFTYFKFPGNRDLPAIYMVDEDGAESIVNRHSTGAASDMVVVHKVNTRWVLRLGDRALAIWNDAYNVEGRKNTTGTASPDVSRVIWRDR